MKKSTKPKVKMKTEKAWAVVCTDKTCDCGISSRYNDEKSFFYLSISATEREAQKQLMDTSTCVVPVTISYPQRGGRG